MHNSFLYSDVLNVFSDVNLSCFWKFSEGLILIYCRRTRLNCNMKFCFACLWQKFRTAGTEADQCQRNLLFVVCENYNRGKRYIVRNVWRRLNVVQQLVNTSASCTLFAYVTTILCILLCKFYFSTTKKRKYCGAIKNSVQNFISYYSA